MSDASNTVEVIDVPAEHRFVVRGDDGEAELLYRVDGDNLELIHTEVPEAWGGRGIGSRLVRAAIRRAEANGLTVVPWCPFARRWLKEHPDEAAGITVDYQTPQPPEA
jgi:predicted GNAT family acetyltransferase